MNWVSIPAPEKNSEQKLKYAFCIHQQEIMFLTPIDDRHIEVVLVNPSLL